MREVTKQVIANIADEIDQQNRRLRAIVEEIGDAHAADAEADDVYPVLDRASDALAGIVAALNRASKIDVNQEIVK